MNIKSITGTILYKNEKDLIELAISHLYSYVDELILCDDQSVDKSYEICQDFPDPDNKIKNIRLPKIISDTWSMPGKRNFMLEFVRSWWVLSMDTDEYFEKELLIQLPDLIKDKKYDIYGIPRKNLIDGKWIKERINEHNEKVSTYPDYQFRLFRSRIRYVGNVHEEAVGYNHKRRLFLGEDGPHIIHDKSSERQYMQDKRYKNLALKTFHFEKMKFMQDGDE